MHTKRITSLLTIFTTLLPTVAMAGSDSDAAIALGITGISFLVLLLVVLVSVVFVVTIYGFTIWMIIDAAQRQYEQKVVWIVLMGIFLAFMPVVGFIISLAYYFSVKRPDKKDPLQNS